ncbi:MAG: redoxin domain-containing protein [Anaerolineae bacterium]|nr:redoxin domain-containing protein [Anaerolineae bacterium]
MPLPRASTRAPKAIPFTLIGVDDRQHSLSDYADRRAVAVIFSCNHCPYVRAWEDRMVQIQAHYAAKSVQLIAINANDATKYPDDSFPKRKERAKEKGSISRICTMRLRKSPGHTGQNGCQRCSCSIRVASCGIMGPSTTTTRIRTLSSSTIYDRRWMPCWQVRIHRSLRRHR